MRNQHFKDSVLNDLASEANIAAFVSFSPALVQRYSQVYGFQANHTFGSVEMAIEALLSVSPERSVNVRSFHPNSVKSQAFVYGLRSVSEVFETLNKLSSDGLYTIVNETVDINDGGVSGVAWGDVIEFAPEDTPRCVEKPGVASLPRALAVGILSKVYGVKPQLEFSAESRVEFSLHPFRRGVRMEHTIVWEVESIPHNSPSPLLTWPNRFSRFLGDKTFGLLVADAMGFLVPFTTVIPRWLPPFRFGTNTGTGETWLRTSPVVPEPGRFFTSKGWTDPFIVLEREDPNRKSIASVLAQEGVQPEFSGSQLVSVDGEVIIEGVTGTGSDFMLGREAPIPLPEEIINAANNVNSALSSELGPVRLEWVHDGKNLWVIQLHKGATVSTSNWIVPGDADHYLPFKVEEGLEKLRPLVEIAGTSGVGIVVIGNVGITSHVGDVLRRAGIPSYIQPVFIEPRSTN